MAKKFFDFIFAKKKEEKDEPDIPVDESIDDVPNPDLDDMESTKGV